MGFCARWFPVAAVLAVAGCGVTQELYNARTMELDRCQSELTRTQSDLTSSRSHLDDQQRGRETCVEENNGLKAEKAKLGSSLQATQLEMEALRRAHAAAEQRAETFRALVARLKPLTDGKQLAVETRHGRMTIAIGEAALFDGGRADLSGAGQALLKQVAAALREIPDRDFLVAAHTDAAPPHAPYRSNWELSAARAVAVVRTLQSEGVDPRHLGAAGYSEFDPASDVEHALNRRVELTIMPSLEELPAIDAAPAPRPQAGATPLRPERPRP